MGYEFSHAKEVMIKTKNHLEHTQHKIEKDQTRYQHKAAEHWD